MNSYESAPDPSCQMNEVPQLPEMLQRRLAEGRVVELDVRPLLAAGQEPFQRIMQQVDRLPDGAVFKLVAPFEPAPLYSVLARNGFRHWTREGAEPGGVWEIYFFQETEPEGIDPNESADTDLAGGAEEIVELDVRGLDPPEPMERVLEAADGLAYGDVLRVTHHRNPLILFDVLGERGFQHRSEKKGEDLWEIRVWRKG